MCSMFHARSVPGLRAPSAAARVCLVQPCAHTSAAPAPPAAAAAARLLCAASRIDTYQNEALGLVTAEGRAAVASVPPELLGSNMDLLQQHFSTKAVAELLQHAPEVLSLPLSDWHQFLTSYGLTNEQLWKVFRYSAASLAASDVYSAGRLFLALTQLGPWSPADVAGRLLPCYPQLLEGGGGQVEGVVAALGEAGLSRDQALSLVWEFPCLLEGGEGAAAHMALLQRIAASRVGKYTQGGCYAV